MKLTDKWEMSEWAYEQCLKGNDTPEMRNLICFPDHAFLYCINIKNIEELRTKVNEPFWTIEYNELLKPLRKLNL